MHSALVQRADDLESCIEGSQEKRELAGRRRVADERGNRRNPEPSAVRYWWEAGHSAAKRPDFCCLLQLHRPRALQRVRPIVHSLVPGVPSSALPNDYA
jgi:hypothetical protein